MEGGGRKLGRRTYQGKLCHLLGRDREVGGFLVRARTIDAETWSSGGERCGSLDLGTGICSIEVDGRGGVGERCREDESRGWSLSSRAKKVDVWGIEETSWMGGLVGGRGKTLRRNGWSERDLRGGEAEEILGG